MNVFILLFHYQLNKLGKIKSFHQLLIQCWLERPFLFYFLNFNHVLNNHVCQCFFEQISSMNYIHKRSLISHLLLLSHSSFATSISKINWKTNLNTVVNKGYLNNFAILRWFDSTDFSIWCNDFHINKAAPCCSLRMLIDLYNF